MSDRVTADNFATMGAAFTDKVEQQAQLRERLQQLQRRAVKFKEADREILVTDRLFTLFELAEEIWLECEQLMDKSESSAALRSGLEATQQEVLLHFLLSSLGYLPAHGEFGGGAVTNKSRLLQVASKSLKMGMRYPELEQELEVFARFMNGCFDAAVELPEFEEVLKQHRPSKPVGGFKFTPPTPRKR